jgi:hypothetical protein
MWIWKSNSGLQQIWKGVLQTRSSIEHFWVGTFETVQAERHRLPDPNVEAVGLRSIRRIRIAMA